MKKKQKGITMRERCETIYRAELLVRGDGRPPTPREIFNYSPRGELFKIREWYAQAKEVLAGSREVKVDGAWKSGGGAS